MKPRLLLLVTTLMISAGDPAQAQYMFLDTNGDGVSSGLDVIGPSTTSIDIYLDTNHNADGTVVTCPTGEQELTLSSYTVIVSAPAGGITFGAWTDNLGFTIDAGGSQAGNDTWFGRATATPLAAGKYKLGSLAITASGCSIIEIHSSSTLDPEAMTSFGTACPGNGFDNTMKLGTDWFDAVGTSVCTATSESTWGKIKNLYRQ